MKVFRVAAAFAALAALSSCSLPVETDQARLCRMALPALSAPDVRLTILNQREDSDGRGLVIGYRAQDLEGASAEHVAWCRFRAPGRPLRSEDLVGIEIDGEALSDAPSIAMSTRSCECKGRPGARKRQRAIRASFSPSR